jgi:hypothetical protein
MCLNPLVPKHTSHAAGIPGIHRRLAEPGGRLAGLDRRALPHQAGVCAQVLFAVLERQAARQRRAD